MPAATELPRPRFADPDRCPDCRHRLPDDDRTRCGSCGLPLLGQAAADLFATLQGADRLLAQLRRQELAPAREWAPPYPVTPAPPSPPSLRPTARRTPAASPAPGVAWTVPGVLLALGALCLLVGAVVFLAVTWALLGVGGRTAVLVVLTALAAAVTGLAARRGLRGAAEALAVVTGAFLALDVAGAVNAGWFGSPDLLTATLVGSLAVATALAVGNQVLSTAATGRLVAPQVLATAGALAATLAALGRFEGHLTTTAVVEVVALLGLAALVRVSQPGLAGGLVGAAGIAWVSLVLDGTAQVGEHLSAGTTPVPWAAVAPYLAAALLTALLAAVPLPVPVRQVAVVVTCGLTGLATAPALVSTWDGLVLVTAGGTVACAILAAASPWRWARQALAVSAIGYAAVGLFPPFLTVVGLGSALSEEISNQRLFPSGLLATADLEAYGAVVGSGWTIPVAAGCVALAVVGLWPRAPRPWTALLVALPVAGVTLLCYVPSLLLAAAICVGLAALHLVAARRGGTAWGRDADLLAAAGWALLGGWVATYHPAPAFAIAVAYVVVATVGALLGSRLLAVVAPVLVAAAMAALGWLADWAPDRVALATVAVVCAHALALGVAGRFRRTADETARLCGYAVALPTALLAGLISSSGDAAASVDRMVATLVITGGATAAVAILERRREAAWLAAGLQLGALWLRLVDTDVRTAEAYSLPLAGVVLAFGAWTLWRAPETGSMATLLPGLGTAFVPTLVLVATDPVSPRALLLAAGCAVAIVWGAGWRLRAPLLAGAVTGAALAIVELAPYHDAVPRWLALGTAGLVLLVAGVRWEALATAGRRSWGRLEALR